MHNSNTKHRDRTSCCDLHIMSIAVVIHLKLKTQNKKESDRYMQQIINRNSVVMISNKNARPFHTIEHKKVTQKTSKQNHRISNYITNNRNHAKPFKKKVATRHKLQNCPTRIESEVRSLLQTNSRSPRHYDMNRKKLQST